MINTLLAVLAIISVLIAQACVRLLLLPFRTVRSLLRRRSATA